MTGTALVPVRMPAIKRVDVGKKALKGSAPSSFRGGMRIDRDREHELKVLLEKPRGEADKALERKRAAAYKANSAPYSRTERGDDRVYAKDDVVSHDVAGIFGEGQGKFHVRLTGTKDQFVLGEDTSAPVQSRIAGRVYNTDQTAKAAKPRPDSPFKRAKASATKVVIIRK